MFDMLASANLNNGLQIPGRQNSKRGLTKMMWLLSIVTFAWASSGTIRQKDLLEMEHPIVRSSASLGSGLIIQSANTTPTSPLDCFQVAEPVLMPGGATLSDESGIVASSESSCSAVLMVHSFANSYGAPFVANYTPPSCDFNRVVINLTVETKGRQYDRLGIMYLGDTEVWKTSTAEPNPTGIRWTYLKDMTQYLSLWKEPQTLIFDLPNIVNDIYTGILNTTLTATFFKSPVETGNHEPAATIIPISARKGSLGEGSQFTLPEETAVNTISNFPRNANRAVFSLSVKAQGDEEFWWQNVPQTRTTTFVAGGYGTYPGYSAWREVQLFIDGQLAGVQWPFPVIFTGGVVPHLHRPIVGLDAFDLREHEIDITPWLPLLCDGNDHTFSINVVGLTDDGSSGASLSSGVGSSWYVTGKVFLWLDDEGSVTTGVVGTVSGITPNIVLSQDVEQNSTGANETLDYDLFVSRDYVIKSQIATQKTNETVTWSQSLTYSNVGGLSAYGWDSLNTIVISGQDSASSSTTYYLKNYNYPLYCNSTANQTPAGNLTLWADLKQSLYLKVLGKAVFPTGLEAFGETPFEGSVLKTWKNSTANYYRPADNTYSRGVGDMNQEFYFGGILGEALSELYYRDVSAYNDTVTRDYEVVAGVVTKS